MKTSLEVLGYKHLPQTIILLSSFYKALYTLTGDQVLGIY